MEAFFSSFTWICLLSNITFAGCLNILASSNQLFFWNDNTYCNVGGLYTWIMSKPCPTCMCLVVCGYFCIEVQCVKSFWKECWNSFYSLGLWIQCNWVDQLHIKYALVVHKSRLPCNDPKNCWVSREQVSQGKFLRPQLPVSFPVSQGSLGLYSPGTGWAWWQTFVDTCCSEQNAWSARKLPLERNTAASKGCSIIQNACRRKFQSMATSG